jgi:hypothetical protein
MISDFTCWVKGTGFQTVLSLSFNYGITGINGPIYSSLSISFDCLPTPVSEGMYSSVQFDESWINAPIPSFTSAQAAKADRWLRDYAKGIQRGLDAGNKPLVARPNPRQQRGG